MTKSPNEGMWLVVTSKSTAKRVAVNLSNVLNIQENSTDDIYNGRRSTINFVNGTSLVVYDSFDEIGEKIR